MIKITRIFILSLLAIIILYDVYAIVMSGTQSSISWAIAKWAYDYPSVSFGAGFVCGHLFWQMNPKKQGLKSDE